MYHCHQLKKIALFSGQVQQYRGTELISFWKRQYYFPNTEVQGYKLLISKMWPSIQPVRSTEVHRYKEKYQKVQRSTSFTEYRRYIGTKTNTKTPEMTTILTKYISTEVQTYRGTELNFSVKQLNIDQIHRYRGTELEFSAVYPLIQQNFIHS